MLKYLLLSLALLVTPALADCKPGDDPERIFFEYTSKNGFEVFTLNETGRAKLVARINQNRANLGKEPVPANSAFYFASIGNGTSGTVLISDGCALSEFVLVFDDVFVEKIFSGAGVLPEEIIKAKEGISL